MSVFHKIQVKEVCELLLGKGFNDEEIVDYLQKEFISDRQLAINELFKIKVWMQPDRRG